MPNMSFSTSLRTTTTSVYNTTNTINTTWNQSEQCPKYQDTKFENTTKILLYVIAMLVSLIGNTLLIYSVKIRKRMRTVTNFLIVNMAVADLFITVFNMPTYLKILVTQKYDWIEGPLGILLCKLVLFIQGVSVTCSVLALTALSIHRFLSVFYPWKKLIDTRNVRFIIIAIWMASCIFISPLLYALNVIPSDAGFFCDEKWSPLFDEEEAPKTYTIVLFVLLYMAPLMIMAVLYTALILKLWSPGSSEVSASVCRRQSEEALSIARVFSDEKAKSSRSSRSKKIVLKMLVTVVVVFALCWLPMHVRVFLYFFNKNDFKCGRLPPFLDFIGYFLGHVNCALNPCIYVFFSESYRQSFKAVLFNRCCVINRKPKITRHYHYKGRACLVEMQKIRSNIKRKK